MKENLTIKINAWIICAVLLVINIAMIAIWQPWRNSSSSDRTIKVTGTATIESEPDQYVFNPYYQKQGTDRTALNQELGVLSDTIVAKLKQLGVKDSAIKVNAYSYDYGVYSETPTNEITATLSLTVTIKDRNLAQSVEDYLVTTSPSGSITPTASFSASKQKALETQARTDALKDAKSKAEASASQLGTKLGKVINVSDISSIGVTPLPWMAGSGVSSMDKAETSDSSSSYTIRPGLDEYSFSIEVTYELD